MRPLGYCCFMLIWLLEPALSLSGHEQKEAGTTSDRSLMLLPREDAFVRSTDSSCDVFWASWPRVQERAIADGTVMIWNMHTSVGNLMRTLMFILPLARLLEVGLIINLEEFPAFRVAFEPELIKWDIDPEPFFQRASEIARGVDANDRHALSFLDGFLILSDSQLELLAETMDATGGSHRTIRTRFRKERHSRWRSYLAQAKLDLAPPCAWNMLLRRSPSMMASMKAHSPWIEMRNTLWSYPHYIAWHIRTSEGETSFSYRADRQSYIFNKQTSENVCPLFLSTIKSVREACSAPFPGGVGDLPVYISSNSKSMARNCSATARARNVDTGFVDLGIDPRDSHTAFSKNPETSVNAFIDFLHLMDASVVIRTSSSFSGAVTDIKGYSCKKLARADLPVSQIYMCLPPDC